MDDWTLVITVLPPLELAWVLACGVYVVQQRRSAQATLAWIFALAFFPVFGILLYVLLGPRRYEKRKRRRAKALAAVDRSTMIVPDEHVEGPPGAQLVRMLTATVGRAGQPRLSDLRVFLDGEAKYEALVEAIDAAEEHVHMEYYIWEPDHIGRRVRDRLTARARAGVEVRVLVDGFGSSKAHDRFWSPLREAGGQVRRFNALDLGRWRPRMANFRTHRKIAVIDGTVGFTGGMNISDVHTSEFSKDDAWRDTHIELRGGAVKGLQMVFFEDWHYAGGDAPEVAPYIPEESQPRNGRHLMQVVSSGPDESLDAIHKLFFTSIAGATRRVQVTTPYFVPDGPVLAALNSAALGGVKVELLVPEGGDQPFVSAAARSYYPGLLESGVRIYEHHGPVLHSKTLVVDDVAVVGTANMDNRSFRLNFEVVVAVHDAAVADRFAKAFEEDKKSTKKVTLLDLHREGFGKRFYSSTARLFSPIL